MRLKRCLTLVTALIFANLVAASAQETHPPIPNEVLPPASQIELDRPVEDSPDPSTLLARTVARSIVSLDASGSRNSEAIANSSVTLVLGNLKDDGHFAALCQSGGDDLLSLIEGVTQVEDLSGIVQKPTCTDSGSAADPFRLTFQLHYEGGSGGLFNESPLLLGASFPDERDESAPIKLGTPHTETSHASMSLPKSWSPDEIPQPIHADSPFASFDRTVTFTDGKLVTDQKLVIKVEAVDSVNRGSFEKWRETSKIDESADVKLASTQYYPWSAFSGATPESKKAADLMSSADQAIDAKDFAKAEADLKEAGSLDPGHQLLHRYKGDLENARGNYAAAIKEYREELRAFPAQTLIMETIAEVQQKMGKRDDAIDTLQTWMNAAPDDFYPPVHLMDLYREMGRDDLAVAVGDRAMLTLSEDGRNSLRFLSTYGHELMLTHRTQDAEAALVKVLDQSIDIDVVNDATYYLSEQGLSLERAEKAMRNSLKQFDQEEGPGIEHLYNNSPKAQTHLMFSSWDTLGWILFKEGRTTEAGSYIRAAWRNQADPAIGRHLGELQLAEEKPIEALDTFRMALATIPRDRREKAVNDPDVIAIRKSIKLLEEQGHVSSLKDPEAAVAALMVLDAGPAGKRRGQEELQIALFPSIITLNRTLDPKTQQDVEQALRAIKLPVDFFPEGSRSTISTTALLDCRENCTLTILR